MAGTLTKQSLVTYTPGSPGVPGTPYVPAIAPYTYTTYDCGGVVVDGPDLNGVYTIIQVTGSGVTLLFTTQPELFCAPVTTTVPGTPAIPAQDPVPPTEAQILISNNIGWNAGALSVASLSGNGGFRWKVAAGTTGMIAGFAPYNTDTHTSRITHGFYFASSALSIMEGGAIKLAGLAYTDGDELRIMRIGTTVTYWINNTLVMTSAVASTGVVHLDVSLYTAGDTVYEPAMFEMPVLSAALPATATLKLSGKLRAALSARGSMIAEVRKNGVVDLRARLAASAAATAGAKASKKLAASCSAQTSLIARLATERVAAVFSALQGYGGEAGLGASCAVSFEAFTSRIYSSAVTPKVGGVNSVFLSLSGSAFGLTGTVSQVSASLSPLIGLSGNKAYCSSSGSLQPLGGSASTLPSDLAIVTSFVGAADELSAERLLLVVLNSSMTAMATMSFVRAKGATAMSSLRVAGVMSGNSIRNVSINEAARLLTDSLVESTGNTGEASVWVINQRTGASWRYDGYNFTQYITLGQFTYGVTPTGLYRIGGDTDAGGDIQASADFGKQDFGSTLHKSMEAAYVTLVSDGELKLRVVDDSGNEYFYAVAPAAPMNTVRTPLGRGLKANYFSLQLYNVGGANFEVADLELLYEYHKRRV